MRNYVLSFVLTVLAVGSAWAAGIDRESQAATRFDLFGNSGFEVLNEARDTVPAQLTIRPAAAAGSRVRGVTDEANAFAGKRWLQIRSKKPVRIWFKLKESARRRVPAELLLTLQTRGQGSVRGHLVYRKAREVVETRSTGVVEVKSPEWRATNHRVKTPNETTEKGQGQPRVTQVGLRLTVQGEVAIDAAHLFDVAALEAAEAESFVTRDAQPLITCPGAERAPVVDGTLDAAEWRRASAVTGFSDVLGNLTPVQTVAYTMRHDETLYFAFKSTIRNDGRPDSMLYGSDAHDFSFSHHTDYIEIHLKTADTADNIQIVVNPAGGVFDRRGKDHSWDAPVTSASRMEPVNETIGGVLTFREFDWTCEVAVDIASLGAALPSDGDAWKINFCRDLAVTEGKRAQSDWTTWVRNSSFHDPDLAELVFTRSLPGIRIESFGDLSSGNIHVKGSVFAAKPADINLEMVVFDREHAGGAVLNRKTEIRAAGRKRTPVDIVERLRSNRRLDAELVVAARHAGTDRSLARTKVPFSYASPFNFAAHVNHHDRDVVCILDRTALDLSQRKTEEASLALAVTAPGASDPALEKTLPIADRMYLETTLDVSRLAPGAYTVTAALVDASGRKLVGGVDRIELLPVPSWQSRTLPVPDDSQVPRPFIPLSVTANKVDFLLRSYTLGNGGLPSRIESLGDNILAEPARLELTRNGKTESVAFSELTPVKTTAAEVVWAIDGAAGDLEIAGTVSVQFDGFALWKIGIEPRGRPAALDSLALTFPLRSRDALYLRAENAVDEKRFATALYKEKTTPAVDIAGFFYNEGEWRATDEFIHMAWLGGDRRGLALMTESDRYLRGPKRLEITKAAGETRMRYNLVSTPIQVEEPLVYEFAWNATPFKEKPADPRKYHSAILNPVRFREYPTFPERNYFWIQHLSKPNLYHEVHARAARLSKLAETYANKLIAYYCFGAGTDVNTDEFKAHAEEFKLTPGAGGTAGNRGLWRTTCIRSGLWQDYLAFKVGKLCGQHGLDGLYLDVSRSAACDNPVHGCGYYDPEKQGRRPTVNIFSNHEFYRRVYTHFKTGGNDDVLYGHGADMAVLPFCEAFFQGESWCMERERAYDRLTPDVYRTIVDRSQYGVPFSFYAFHQYSWRGGKFGDPTPPDTVIMMGMQHHNHYHVNDLSGVEPALAIREYTAPFWTSSTFIPYWSEQTPVSTGNPHLLGATYVKQEEKRAWIFVSNWTDSRQTGTVALNQARLGFEPQHARIMDPLTNRHRDAESERAVTITVPARDFLVVEVNPREGAD